MHRTWTWKLAALLVALSLVASACGDDDDDPGDASSGGASTASEAASTGLLGDGEACDSSLDPYAIGILTVFESSLLTLVDNVTAVEASVEAFNGRGGVGGHCMELTTCDSEADPNKELDCARQFVDDGIVALLNDTAAFNAQGVSEVLEAAGIPRIGSPSSTQDLASPVTYALSGGSAGLTMMMVPPLLKEGYKKIAAIHVDTPTIQGLFGALAPMLEAADAEMVATIPVPAGTTDFQQFILAAEEADAEGVILALGETEAKQVLQAASQLGSELTYSGSLGTFGLTDIKELGDIAGRMVLVGDLPPQTASQERWPILADSIKDLEASGDAALSADQVKTAPFVSWVAVAAFVKVIEEFGTPDEISAEAIAAAFDAAKDVDMYDIVPPWTPSVSPAGPGPFARISNPWYYNVTFDVDEGEWVVSDERLNMLMELGGITDYEQPG